jgi:hypothetical protein
MDPPMCAGRFALRVAPEIAGLFAVLSFTSLPGCSSKGDQTASNRPSWQPTAATGAAGMSVPTSSTGIAGSSDNPNTGPNGIAPIVPIMNATGGTAATAMNTPSTIQPISIDNCAAGNAAGLSAADVQKLAAAANPAGLKWLYPYEGTVFPRGMGAPLLMWDGAATATAAYVHIKSMAFEYRGCLKPTAAGQLELPHEVWVQAGERTFGKTDPYTLELALWSGGNATGPLTLHFNIAQATIKGSIYYNSYESKLNTAAPMGGFGFGGPSGGIVLRIPQGGQAEVFASMGCIGCHSVSADGSNLIAQLVPGNGQGYELVAGGGANPPATVAGPRAAYGAMYPDGSAYLAMGGQIDVARSLMTQGQGALTEATVYDTTTGQAIASKGIPVGSLMPMFSPDGTLLAFNDYAIGMAAGLAVMKYDVKTHTASDYKMLMKDSGKTRPAWPFILPDNDAVIFLRTESMNFSGDSVGLGGQMGGAFGGAMPAAAAGPASDLYIADRATGMVTLLAKAMGFDKPENAVANTTYLPFGVDDLHRNYYPTVSPVAAGGYFWVFFDSYRHYGNLGKLRQLWGAAIEIQADGSYVTDVSHPPFYLPGQELGTGNHRAFASLDPCKKDGDKCSSGIDCCGGRCYLPDSDAEFVEPIGSCTPPKDECAKTNERCVTDSDCCPPEPGEPKNSCIAGFCAYLNLQ